MLFTDQRFCMTPPYRTARPGRLISPTNVAAVICHALSPGFSQLGYAQPGTCASVSYRCGSAAHPTAHADRAHRMQCRYEIRRARTAGRATLANTSAPGFRHLSRRPRARPRGARQPGLEREAGARGRRAPQLAARTPRKAAGRRRCAARLLRRSRAAARRRACSRTSRRCSRARRRAARQRVGAERDQRPATTHAEQRRHAVFSRRPQCSGSDSRLDCSSMIMRSSG